MSEQEEGKLKATEVYRLLDHLCVYMGSSHAQIEEKKGAPDTCGNNVHLDGEAFLQGFAEYLDSFELEKERMLSELCLIMEISTYVRNGGIKAVLYRLETGSASIAENYFDVLSRLLSLKYEDGKFVSVLPEFKSNLMNRLKQINPEDEARVSAAISEIDQVLLDLSRKLEARSEEKLAGAEKKES